MTERVRGSLALRALLIGVAWCWVAAASAAESQHVCVPGADGRWRCGDASAPPEAAPIPAPAPGSRPTPVPPVLLMDPARFRVDAPTPGAAPPAAAAASSTSTAIVGVASEPVSMASTPPPAPTPPVVRALPAPTTAPVSARSPVPVPAAPARVAVASAPSGHLRALAEVARTGYTLQLAAAQSPDGFLAHLRRLGVAPEQAFALPIQRAGQRLWLLCLGEATDVAGARALTPAGAPDAFVKPLTALFAEWTGEG